MNSMPETTQITHGSVNSPTELAEPPVCPSWCTHEHRSERAAVEFRDCDSEEVFIPTLKSGVLGVNVSRTFDRTTGALFAATVLLEDHELTSQYARHLAQVLIRAADLAERIDTPYVPQFCRLSPDGWCITHGGRHPAADGRAGA